MATAIMDNAYNYFLTTYGTQKTSRYDSHKRSELRNTYNNIVKVNKESPLYKIKDSKDLEKFVIDVKENARNIKNVIASLSSEGSGIESAFQKKVAVSTKPDVVDAHYIGNGDDSEASSRFAVEVKQLATPQTNIGNSLRNDTLDILPGSYSFDLSTTTASYEFQFSVNDDNTNEQVLNKIARLVNSANIGLEAGLISEKDGFSALKIESKQTGLPDGSDYVFHIAPDGANLSKAAMNTLGIDRVASPAHDSLFLLDGTEHSSHSNTFSINNTFELTLKDVSSDYPAVVGYKTSVDAVADNIQTLVDSYNQMIDTAASYADTQRESSRLKSDIGNVGKRFQDNFEPLGLMVDTNGAITINRDVLADAIGNENAKESFSILNQFKDALNIKAERASIDPLSYVNKIMVAYKNPGHSFATPYITSIYSGLMLDAYC